MQCIVHSDRAATARCSGCAEALCPDCHVEIAGGAWCQNCKASAVKRPPIIVRRMEPSSLARNGMIIGLVGLIFFTIVCGIVAIALGIKAHKEIAENPRMCGGGRATAAICIGCVDLLFFMLVFVNKG